MREKAGEIMARKVLIVEDDNNIAELLHLYLEKDCLLYTSPSPRDS